MTYRELVASRDRMRSAQNANRNLVVVVGPPCSGKSTHVASQMRPGDVVVDLDALAVALGSTEPHDHSRLLLNVAHAAREGVIARVLRDAMDGRVWVILTSRTQVAQFDLQGATVHVMPTDLVECERRAVAAGRTSKVIDLIRNWQG